MREQFVRRGMVADVNIHAPHRDGDSRNYHAHILLPTREISPEGFTEKNRDWNKTETLEKWRGGWERIANRYLERHGHEARIDRRTLQAQGIDREPTQHLGPQITAMNRRGISSDRYAELSVAENHHKGLAQARAELAETSREITQEQARVSEPENPHLPDIEKTRPADPRAAIVTHSAELVKTRQEQERQQLQAKQTEERATLAAQIENKIDMRRRVDGMAQEEREKRRTEMVGHGNVGLFDHVGMASQNRDAMRYKDDLNRQATQKRQEQERQKKREAVRQQREVDQYKERQRAATSTGIGTQAGTGNKEMTDKAREKQERVERYLKQMNESERQHMERGGGRERTRER